jgi:hypothetical protein
MDNADVVCRLWELVRELEIEIARKDTVHQLLKTENLMLLKLFGQCMPSSDKIQTFSVTDVKLVKPCPYKATPLSDEVMDEIKKAVSIEAERRMAQAYEPWWRRIW